MTSLAFCTHLLPSRAPRHGVSLPRRCPPRSQHHAPGTIGVIAAAVILAAPISVHPSPSPSPSPTIELQSSSLSSSSPSPSPSAPALIPVPQHLPQHHLRADVPSVQDSNLLFRTHWEIHSVESHTETFLIFSNRSPSVVDLWWIDYCGQEVYYASIDPGSTHMQPSFVTHPWVVRDHISQNTLLMLVSTSDPTVAVVRSS